MMYFAKTKHQYHSYRDFWRLVELAGFETKEVLSLNLSAQDLIITTMINDEWPQMIGYNEGRRRRAHLILWNLERPVGWAGSVGAYGEKCHELLHTRQFDEIWVSDRRLADECELRFVPLGSHPGLGTPGVDKKYAFVHMSCIVPRRQAVYSQFAPEAIAPNGWGEAKHKSLQEAFFALNIHQDNHPFCEPLRLALFAAYGLPVLSEAIYNPFPAGGEIIFNNYKGIAAKLRQMLENDYARWWDMGMRFRELLTKQYEFGAVVRSSI